MVEPPAVIVLIVTKDSFWILKINVNNVLICVKLVKILLQIAFHANLLTTISVWVSALLDFLQADNNVNNVIKLAKLVIIMGHILVLHATLIFIYLTVNVWVHVLKIPSQKQVQINVSIVKIITAHNVVVEMQINALNVKQVIIWLIIIIVLNVNHFV